MAEYKGASSEGQRQAMLEKQRAKMLSEFEKQREKITKDNQVNVTSSKFVTQNADVEGFLKKETVGLYRLEDFQKIRMEIEVQKEREAARTSELNRTDKLKKSKKKKKPEVKLSFDIDGEEEISAGSKNGQTGEKRSGDSMESVPKKSKIGKNPSVDTSFLPDREREEQERREREQLRLEWLRKEDTLLHVQFTIGPVRFHVTDPLFDPSLVGKQEILSLSDAIHLAITSCEPDRRQLLFENIVVTGGISLIKGLKERILKELHRFLSITENAGEFQTRECKCLKIPEYFTAYKDRPDLAGFLGAAIVAKLVFPEPKNFITKIDYNENGPSVVHVKSY